MDERKSKILYSIIQDFIYTGEPVGSRTLSKKYNLGISSATIRNEMSDLEELGFLEQVHISSGRRPSNKGYRLYVDKLMKPKQISNEEKKYIESNLLNLDLFDLENILKSKLSLISKLTNLACVLKIPPVIENSIKSIEFIKISTYSLLAVIITNEGIIRNNIIKLNRPIDHKSISVINKIINDHCVSRRFEDINLDLVWESVLCLNLDRNIFDQLILILHNLSMYDAEASYYFEGIDNVLSYPEFNSIDKVRELVCFFNNINRFNGLLNCDCGNNIQIKIGEENSIEEAKNYSVVLGNCIRNGKVLGTIGIIGLTRMDYAKIVTMVKFLIDFINTNID